MSDYELETLERCVEHLATVDKLLEEFAANVGDGDARRAHAYLGQRFAETVERLEEGRRIRSFQHQPELLKRTERAIDDARAISDAS